MPSKLTQGEFIERSVQTHGDKYDYSLVKYKNNRTHVDIICHNHDDPFIFKQTPYKHANMGQGCPLCAGKYSYDYKIFIRKAKKIHGDKYSYKYLKGDYVDNRKKVRIICPEHGEFTQSPNGHLNDRGCNKCVRREFNSKEDFIQEANIVHNNKYDYSKSHFKSLNDHIIIIYPDHGEFKQLAHNHVYGSGCRKCSGCEPYTQESIIEKFKESHGDTYGYSKVEFKDIRSKVIIICEKHGEFRQEPFMHYYSKQGCPKCKSSKGEIEVMKALDNLQINYEHQHKFKDCKGKQNSLPFDFYLPDYNLVIEYDGKQHFKVNEHFGGEKAFKDLKINDSIKNKYCEENGIDLLRIPYYDFNNIEDILKIKLGFKFKIGNYKLTCSKDKNFNKILDYFNISKGDIGKVKCVKKPNCFENECHNNVNNYVSLYGGGKISGYYLVTETDTDKIYAIRHSIYKKENGDIVDITPFDDNREFNIFFKSDIKDRHVKIE